MNYDSYGIVRNRCPSNNLSPCLRYFPLLVLPVVPVLFDYALAPRKRLVKNLNISAGAEAGLDVEISSTTAEVVLALRVLEGCCLLYSGCRTTASQHAAVSVLTSFSSRIFPVLHARILFGFWGPSLYHNISPRCTHTSIHLHTRKSSMLSLISDVREKQEVIDLFLAGGSPVQSACLDGLLAIMLESPSNQKVCICTFQRMQ